MAFSLHQSLRKTHKTNLVLVLVGVVGLILLALGTYLKYKKTVLSFSQTPPEIITVTRTAMPININIPKANINIEIEESKIIDGIWEISDSGASYLSSSARPGENGNIVIYGHNKRQLFGNLVNRDLIGQEVLIKSLDGKTHKYRISETKVVNPTEIEEVLPTSTEVLTLYTCTGVLDTKRLIVKALPIN